MVPAEYSPSVIRMDYRLPVLENATRNHGVTLGAVAARLTDCRGVAEGIAGDARTELSATHVRRVRQREGVAVAMSDPDELFDDDLIDRIANSSRLNYGPSIIERSAIAVRCPKTMKCYEFCGRCSSWLCSW